MELEVKGLYKTFGSKKVLNDVNLQLNKGIYGLLGPNGAGKSTLINILVDNLSKDRGQVLVDGKSIYTMGEEFRSLIGFMPQQQGLYDNFTAIGFLAYIAGLKGMEKKRAKAQIEKVLEQVNLTEVAHNRLGGFSGGMKQRILIAQAILDEPQILILDEPTAGLDPKERIRIRNLIAKISLNKIVIIATHVVTDIEFIAKEIILIKEGRIIEKNTPARLIESIKDKVYELEVKEEELEKIQEEYQVGNIYQSDEGLLIRIITEEVPSQYRFHHVRPVLEDLYLYRFSV